MDATLVTAHSDKECAAPTFKRGFGFHPLWAFVDHGPEGTGEPLAVLLRAGNAGSNTVADHVTVLREALAQLPGSAGGRRPGKDVLIRVDGAGGTHGLIEWLTRRRLAYSVGFSLPGDPERIQQMLTEAPADAWTAAYDADGQVRPGAWVAELTGMFDLTGWPPGMRLIVRKERPHPGAQLRITDVDGHRITAFSHLHVRRAAGRPGAAAPPPGPRRGPDPLREGHRPGQPAAARLRPERDLVRDRGAGRRPDCLDADPGPDRHRRPTLGTQAPAPAAVLDPGAPRPHRPPPAAAPGRDRTVHRTRSAGPRHADPADQRTGSGAGLTCGPTVPTIAARPGTWNRRPPERPRRTVTPRCHSHAHAGPEPRRPSK